ncbi:histidine protein methyltransferase 1 homolog [Elysia marginata]|uniref:protein-histidine N-methyltransferase n=1 Tax=Elysia marginata TaxID=1093978 RepID=A0AAV4EG34_9GAST|nr:histidine protein methyltransferase 1 homolog [Elysia marginata]
MSFLFNFEPDEDDEKKPQCESAHFQQESELKKGNRGANTVDTNAETKCALEAKEVTEFCGEELVLKFKTITKEFGQQRLKVVDTSTLGVLLVTDKDFKDYVEGKAFAHPLVRNSDLESGVYEGGLKMWECGDDLTQFLSSHPKGQTIELRGKSILELGCGAGLPGLYCCGCGAKAVHFQDFNEEVLQLVTHTNVSYNVQKTDDVQCCYFSGEWSSFSQLLQKKKQIYDVILTAETIYSPENYSSLHDVFSAALAHNGVIVIAAKVYYFGVGGSTDGFLEYVESQKLFTAETVHTIKSGVPRMIILLRRQEMSSSNR